MLPIDFAFKVGEKLIDKFFFDDIEKQNAQAEMARMIHRGELDELALNVEDRNSARKREMATKDSANIRIGSLILMGFFSTLGVLFFVQIQTAMKDTLLLMVGGIGHNGHPSGFILFWQLVW